MKRLKTGHFVITKNGDLAKVVKPSIVKLILKSTKEVLKTISYHKRDYIVTEHTKLKKEHGEDLKMVTFPCEITFDLKSKDPETIPVSQRRLIKLEQLSVINLDSDHKEPLLLPLSDATLLISIYKKNNINYTISII